MKNSIISTTALTIIILSSIFISACDTKHPADPDHGSVMVTMTYLPNPATANTPIECNFSVMEDDMPVDVSDVTCEIKQGSSDLTPMSLTKSGDGMYMGTYTFPEMKSYTMTFNFNHDGEMDMKEFTINVQ